MQTTKKMPNTVSATHRKLLDTRNWWQLGSPAIPEKWCYFPEFLRCKNRPKKTWCLLGGLTLPIDIVINSKTDKTTPFLLMKYNFFLYPTTVIFFVGYSEPFPGLHTGILRDAAIGQFFSCNHSPHFRLSSPVPCAKGGVRAEVGANPAPKPAKMAPMRSRTGGYGASAAQFEPPWAGMGPIQQPRIYTSSYGMYGSTFNTINQSFFNTQVNQLLTIIRSFT